MLFQPKVASVPWWSCDHRNQENIQETLPLSVTPSLQLVSQFAEKLLEVFLPCQKPAFALNYFPSPTKAGNWFTLKFRLTMQCVTPQTRREALIILPRLKKNICQFVVFALALHVVMTKGASDRRVDLGDVCQSMWNVAGDNLKTGKEIGIYRGSFKNHPLITVTKLGKKKMQRPIYVKFKALLNSFEAEEGKAATASEEEAFIDAVSIRDGPMEIAFKYIKKNCKIPSQNLDQFKHVLKKMWFDKFSKKGRGTNISGFQHTFVGQVRSDGPKKTEIVEGFHNWIQFVSEEKARKLFYFPPPRNFVDGPPALISANFNWRGAKKPNGSSFFIGTSPAFEMALYTACFFRSSPAFDMEFYDPCPARSPECTCQLNKEQLKIIATNCNGYVLTAYPRL